MENKVSISGYQLLAGLVPATFYQLKFKKELSILYSISATIFIGLIWWWGLYNAKQESKKL